MFELNALRPSLLGFITSFLLWMLFFFAVWFYGHDVIIYPAFTLVEWGYTYAFSDVVHSMAFKDQEIWLLLNYSEVNGELINSAQAGEQLAFRVNPRILSYSIPFFCSLMFAVNAGFESRGIWIGLVVLYGFIVVGLFFCLTKTLLFDWKDIFYLLGQPVSDLTKTLVAFGYQFSVLAIPVLVPVILWCVFERTAIKELVDWS